MRVVISGASGGIGRALTDQYLDKGHEVWAISHCKAPGLSDAVTGKLCLDWLEHPGALTDWLVEMVSSHGKPDMIISCTGFLHSEHQGPEKQLSHIEADFFRHNMTLNAYAHIQLAQCLETIFTRKDRFHFAALSALVGSITNNELGGWYSYRMSKAALNMFIKTLSIEWQRRYPHAAVVAVHPGTTDTPLSQPFQAGIADGKLYSPELTASRLMQVFSELTPEQSGSLLFWDGSKLPY